MKHYLLLGAGFSRNWGGWLASEAFEYLLGDAAVTRNAKLKDLLWKNQPKGGFEAALNELRQAVLREHSQQPLLAALESAVGRMFDAMDSGYISQPFEFRDSMVDRRPLQTFLSRFTAIFTLNQDLLLERHYLANKDNNIDVESWKQWQLPGMRLLSAEQGRRMYPSAIGLWQPSGDHVIGPEQPNQSSSSTDLQIGAQRTQRGCSSWVEGRRRRSPATWSWTGILRNCPGDCTDTRLMIIGYSFRDDHINEVLQVAIAKGLKLFVIDTNGSDVARVLNSTAQSGQIYSKTRLEEDLQHALIGASRRSLREIFGNDEIERAKVMRFFET